MTIEGKKLQYGWFLETRRKGPFLPGTINFITLRSLDVMFQYSLLRTRAGPRFIYPLGGIPITELGLSSTLILGLSSY